MFSQIKAKVEASAKKADTIH